MQSIFTFFFPLCKDKISVVRRAQMAQRCAGGSLHPPAVHPFAWRNLSQCALVMLLGANEASWRFSLPSWSVVCGHESPWVL